MRAVLVLGCVAAAFVSLESCEIKGYHIFGGTVVGDPSKYSWMAALLRNGGWAGCGGTLVGGGCFVITAAHCIKRSDMWVYQLLQRSVYVCRYTVVSTHPADCFLPPSDSSRRACRCAWAASSFTREVKCSRSPRCTSIRRIVARPRTSPSWNSSPDRTPRTPPRRSSWATAVNGSPFRST